MGALHTLAIASPSAPEGASSELVIVSGTKANHHVLDLLVMETETTCIATQLLDSAGQSQESI